MDTLAEVDDVIASRPVKLLNGHWHDNLPGVAWWRDLDAVRHNDRSRVISRYDDALRTHRLTTSIRSLAESAAR